MRETLDESKFACKAKLPMPALLHMLGFGAYAKRSCPSPLRKDKNPSWGIFQREGKWFFKDLATGETGDELDLIGSLLGIAAFPEQLEKYRDLAGVLPAPAPGCWKPSFQNIAKKALPDRSGFGPGTTEQLKALSNLRGIGLPGIQLASERGVLKFGLWKGQECWGLTDLSGKVMELRRLDGKQFPAIGDLSERKSHAIRYSQKSWPVGILEAASFSKIALVEGMPDFLEAHYLAIWEGKPEVAPVTILAATPMINEEALPLFAGKQVRIFPHAEIAGANGALRWAKQLRSVGAVVDCFDFGGLKKRDGTPVNDLLDFSAIHPAEIESKRAPVHILP